MNKRFITPDLTDGRIIYAADYLEQSGCERVEQLRNADFVLLGVNPKARFLEYSLPIFAGNVEKTGVFDYTKDEAFATQNAYFTAEGAVASAIAESKISLFNSKVLIIGYGRIGKALHRCLSVFTNNITVCVRKPEAATLARCNGADVMTFEELKYESDFEYIFNTVPHPVLSQTELKSFNKSVLLIELASFPGGIDRHFAEHYGLKLLVLRGVPSMYSPVSAGITVGKIVERIIKEVIV